MMNLSFISPKTWSRITRGALSWEQDYSNEDACHRYRVTYPNGYGVTIIGYPYLNGHAKLWRVILLQNGELCIEDSDALLVKYAKSEGEVYDICDIVSRA